MNGLVPYSIKGMILKDISELPKHVTLEQVREMRKWVHNNERGQVKDTDMLLLNLCFELGGRVTDICQLKSGNVNIQARTVHLYMRKVNRNAVITISDALALQIELFLERYPKRKGAMLGFSRQNAWARIKKISQACGMKGIHPHMFRHGLGLYLMGCGTPIPVISARLGHSNVQTTMNLYLKVTEQIQRDHMQNVPFE